MRKSVVIFFLLLSASTLSQTDSLAQDQQDGHVRFSTIPHASQESLRPFYKLLKNTDNGPRRFSVIEQLAAYHIDKGNSDSIVQYGNLYLRELHDWDSPDEAKLAYFSKAYYMLASGSRLNGLLDNAIQWHIKGITASEAIKNSEYGYRNKIGLAHIYNVQQKPRKAISILEDFLPALEKRWPELLPSTLTYLGDSQYAIKAYDTAQTEYKKALVQSKKAGDLKQELTLNLKLGSLAERENRIDEAFDLYNSTREKGLENGLNTLYFEGTIQIGELFYGQKNYEAANAALSVAYINAIERENLEYQKEILDIQRRTFADSGDYDNAYAVMTQLAAVKSRITARQKQKIIKELEVRYETLEKEREISSLEEGRILQQAELKRQKTIKNAVLIGFLVVLVPVLGLLYVYYQKLQAQSQLAEKQAEVNFQKVNALKREQELELIKASIAGQDEERKRIAQELHDSIGGNLAGIKLQLASAADSPARIKSINGQLDETYQLVRNISHTLVPKKFRENAFTDLVREYTRSISGAGNIEVGFYPHPEPAINAIDEKIQLELYKIVQELMTNVLKHADAGKVDIHLSLMENELSLLFEDDGKGFDLSKTAQGIGFDNLRNRVDTLNGGLHIDSVKKRGTVIALEIPIKSSKP